MKPLLRLTRARKSDRTPRHQSRTDSSDKSDQSFLNSFPEIARSESQNMAHGGAKLHKEVKYGIGNVAGRVRSAGTQSFELSGLTSGG